MEEMKQDIKGKMHAFDAANTLINAVNIERMTDTFGQSIARLADDFYIVNVISTSYQYQDWGQYPTIDLFGDKYVPLLENNSSIWQSHVDKLAKLVIDSNDKYTIRTYETLDLGGGYALKVNQVDVDGKKVCLEFSKDGYIIDDQIVSTDSGDDTWVCVHCKIECSDHVPVLNVPVLRVHVSGIFLGAVDSIVQIDGIWLIDFANVMTLKIGDKFEASTLAKILCGANESNPGSLIFEKDLVAPVAAFLVDPSKGIAPLIVEFRDLSTGSPTSWEWDFGDGKTSTAKSPSHTYPSESHTYHSESHTYHSEGIYKVKLTVCNSSGESSAIEYVTVILAQELVVDFSASPISGKAPLEVKFTDDSMGSATSWYWKFGDNHTSPEKNPTHTYNKPGNYTVSLSVSNGLSPCKRLERTRYITVT